MRTAFGGLPRQLSVRRSALRVDAPDVGFPATRLRIGLSTCIAAPLAIPLAVEPNSGADRGAGRERIER